MKWFSFSWWSYLFSGCSGWRNFWCRVGGHRCGVVWFRAGGLKPDMHCKNCDEDLG